MNIREDAIYGRQSINCKDRISIESQIEFCKYELRGGTSSSTPTRAVPARTRTAPVSRN